MKAKDDAEIIETLALNSEAVVAITEMIVVKVAVTTGKVAATAGKVVETIGRGADLHIQSPEEVGVEVAVIGEDEIINCLNFVITKYKS